MESKYLDINFRARYFTLGSPSPRIKYVWMVCHGYGQLAERFISKFEVLNDGTHFVTAPEGLSRFYLSHTEKRIGASWMTSEERLVEIDNYLNYLNQVFEQIMSPIIQNSGAAINLLGFSQGASTICRFANQENISFDRLILWAGSIPPDLDYDIARSKFNRGQVDIIYGDQDQYINPEHLAIQEKAVRKLKIHPRITVFHGKHSLVPKVLEKLVNGID